MGDDWFGHRDPFTGKPMGDKDEFTEWDYVLANAVQTIEDYTTADGLLAWEVDEDGVDVDAIKKINKFESAKQRKTSVKNYKPTPGEYFIPAQKKARGKDRFQTIGEWRKSMQESDNE